jgi:hypothetical protein
MTGVTVAEVKNLIDQIILRDIITILASRWYACREVATVEIGNFIHPQVQPIPSTITSNHLSR